MVEDKPLVWLTGAGGQLGTALLRLFPDPQDFAWVPTGHVDLDLADEDAVLAFYERISPTFIVNCAAYTNVEGAEDHPSEAAIVNAEVPRLLSSLCERVIHVGTDYVYDGAKGTPYTEGEVVENPLSVYGATKLRGELSASANGATVLRTSWLYGPMKWGSGGFYGKIRKQVEVGAPLRVVTDEKSTPTSTLTLARVILALIERTAWTPGIYHVTDIGSASRYDFATEIAHQLGSTVVLAQARMDDFPTKAKRPHYSVLAGGKMLQQFPHIFKPWEEALSEVIEIDNE